MHTPWKIKHVKQTTFVFFSSSFFLSESPPGESWLNHFLAADCTISRLVFHQVLRKPPQALLHNGTSGGRMNSLAQHRYLPLFRLQTDKIPHLQHTEPRLLQRLGHRSGQHAAHAADRSPRARRAHALEQTQVPAQVIELRLGFLGIPRNRAHVAKERRQTAAGPPSVPAMTTSVLRARSTEYSTTINAATTWNDSAMAATSPATYTVPMLNNLVVLEQSSTRISQLFAVKVKLYS